jgi:hypothetical protein
VSGRSCADKLAASKDPYFAFKAKWFTFGNKRFAIGLVVGGLVTHGVAGWPRTWEGLEAAVMGFAAIPIMIWIARKFDASSMGDKYPGGMDWTNEGNDCG